MFCVSAGPYAARPRFRMAVVPGGAKGIEHKPCASPEVKLLLIEPRGVVNTGDSVTSERAVLNDRWI